MGSSNRYSSGMPAPVFSLVQSDHVTWILASHWSRAPVSGGIVPSKRNQHRRLFPYVMAAECLRQRNAASLGSKAVICHIPQPPVSPELLISCSCRIPPPPASALSCECLISKLGNCMKMTPDWNAASCTRVREVCGITFYDSHLHPLFVTTKTA